MDKELWTIWVCLCCMLSHATGECCVDDAHGGDSIEPWSATDFEKCRIFMSDGEDHYSTSQCDGCGSWLYGPRYEFMLEEI